MKFIAAILVILFCNTPLFSEPFRTEKKILVLSKSWKKEMNDLAEYDGLKMFCRDDEQKQLIFYLLDEIHQYHGMLYDDLMTTEYNHSKRTIKRILKHIDK